MFAAVGLGRVSMPREMSFCTDVVAPVELLAISDTYPDACFADHPAVKPELVNRSYCGYPFGLRTARCSALCACSE